MLCAMSLLVMSGCANLRETFNFTHIDEDGNEIKKEQSDLPAKKLLMQGMEDYNVGKYFTAIDAFEEILNRYPFSPEALLAELKAADCSYLLERYVEALMLYEEFENRHPTNESIPYVMYQKGMCHFRQIDRIDRDTSGAEKAVTLFQQLVAAYPDSPYTEDAKKRIRAATEFLANHEYLVTEYYIRTKKPDQAKVRLKYLLAMYPETAIAGKARQLLQEIEAGNSPQKDPASWFSKLTQPDWNFPGSDDSEEESKNTAE